MLRENLNEIKCLEMKLKKNQLIKWSKNIIKRISTKLDIKNYQPHMPPDVSDTR
jgi:hypothetical protein